MKKILWLPVAVVIACWVMAHFWWVAVYFSAFQHDIFIRSSSGSLEASVTEPDPFGFPGSYFEISPYPKVDPDPFGSEIVHLSPSIRQSIVVPLTMGLRGPAGVHIKIPFWLMFGVTLSIPLVFRWRCKRRSSRC